MMDVTEGDDEVILRAELPGIDPKDVEVTVSGNLLTLSGEKKRVNEHRRDHCFHRECCYGSFRRSIELPQGIDPEKVVAEHANGVLTVRLKRTESDKAKHIPVKVQEE
jgi:HSP20 family protein